MNTIRKVFKQEVEDLLPVLHNTYRFIGVFQNNRSVPNEVRVKEQLNVIGKHLSFFKPYLQANKQAYFTAILDEDLSTSDRIIALDVAIGAMHIEYSMPRAYMHQESKELKAVLEKARMTDEDLIKEMPPKDDTQLVQGIGASQGIVAGKAVIIRKKSDYKRVPSGSIIIAKMTRPEILASMEKVVGIVTDEGGRLCHAAIVAREKGIPCVVGTENATKVIKEHALIELDGKQGTVRRVR